MLEMVFVKEKKLTQINGRGLVLLGRVRVARNRTTQDQRQLREPAASARSSVSPGVSVPFSSPVFAVPYDFHLKHLWLIQGSACSLTFVSTTLCLNLCLAVPSSGQRKMSQNHILKNGGAGGRFTDQLVWVRGHTWFPSHSQRVPG